MLQFPQPNKQYALKGAYCLFLFLAACGPTVTPTPFVPPTDAKGQPPQSTVVIFSTSTPEPGVVSSAQVSSGSSAAASSEPAVVAGTTPTDCASNCPGCTNALKFLADVTIPDGTIVSAGEAVDKQWSVQNDGTCDWGTGYVLKLVSGDPMGTGTEIALFPARAGAQAVIDIELTAPQQPGPYHTVWQAYAPDGSAFDQPIYVDIVVQ